MKNENTARRLRDALRNAELTAQELADRSGVSKNSISQYVNGIHVPSNVSASKMGKVLGVSPLWLMGYDVPDNTVDVMMNLFNQLDKADKDRAIGYIQALLDNEKYSKKDTQSQAM